MPVPPLLGTVHQLADIHAGTGFHRLPADPARRVANNLHKCNPSAAVFENMQPKMNYRARVAPLARESGQALPALFKIGLGAEKAGLYTRCNESHAMMRAKSMVGKRLSDQTLQDCI